MGWRRRQLHAEGKLFVTEMKIRDEEAVEEERAHSDDEQDDAASAVLQEPAAEPPLPPPPPRVHPEDPEVKRRREILERCIAL